MWLSFLAVFLVGILILYLPGSLFFWACGAPVHYALIAAPMFSLVGYEAVAIVLPFAAIKASFVTVFIPVLLLSLLLALISFLSKRKTNTYRGKISLPGLIDARLSAKQDVIILCLYVAIGVIATIFIFVKALDGPCSFVQTYDNLHHFALARSYIESGIWSPLQTIPYIEGNDGFFNSLPGMSYYPTGWNLLVALLSSAVMSPLPMSANAINAVFCAIVFPSSMYLLMKCIFTSHPKVILCGSLLVMAFSVFPWDILMAFPLLPNMTSMALAPIFIVAFMRLASLDASKKERLIQLLLLATSVATFFFMHPNSVFTGALFLIPFCAYRIGQIVTLHAGVSHHAGATHDADVSHHAGATHHAGASHIRLRHIVLYKIVPACLFIMFALVVWYLLFKLPFLQRTVWYARSASASALKTVFDILTLRFTLNSSQIMLAGIVCIGFGAILRMPKYVWLDCSFILAACFYFCSSALGDAAINHFLTGFWYTDPHRVGAVIVLSAIPLAGVGLATVFTFVKNRLKYVCEIFKNSNTQKLIAKIPYLVIIVCVLLCYLPSITVNGTTLYQSSLQEVIDTSIFYNDRSLSEVYDDEEYAFVEDVKHYVDPDDVILNVPADGSLLAYSMNNLNVVNRYYSGYGTGDEADFSPILRERLYRYAFDAEVQDAIDYIDADYVLLLKTEYDSFETPYWTGYAMISDDTCGFEVVLRNGEMRLYKIL